MKKNNKYNKSSKTTAEVVSLYSVVRPQLNSAYNEIKELSKKNPDGRLNAFKVELLNKLLNNALTVLEKEPTKEYLALLDDVTLPSNSDALIMLGQFISALGQFHNTHFNTEGKSFGGDWDCWED